MGKKRRQTKRKLTANQQEWEQQVKNLKRRIKALEKYAYVDFEIPERPERVTKRDIARIKNIRRKELLEYASSVDILTGEVTRYVPPKPRRRSRKAPSEELEPLPYPTTDKPVAIEDKILSEMENLIETYTGNQRNPSLTEHTRSTLLAALHSRAAQIGRSALSQILEEEVTRENLVKQALDESNGERVKGLNMMFIEMLYGRSLSTSESRDVGQFLESFEDFSLPQ